MSTSARLATVAEQIGAEHRIEFDLTTVVLRATGPARWDVYGTGDLDGRLYGTISAAEDDDQVVYSYRLRNYRGGLNRLNPDLHDAVNEIVSDWPDDVDPVEAVKSAANSLEIVGLVLTDRVTAWSGDYETLLTELGKLSRRLTGVYDHLHGQAMVIAAELDSAAWGKMAEQTADAAHESTLITMSAESAAGSAHRAQADTPAHVARQIVAAYGAARAVEACAGRTAAERGAGR